MDMPAEQERMLLGARQFQVVQQVVNHVVANGFDKFEGWLFAGALLQYTGNRKIDKMIIDCTDPVSKTIYKGPVGNINNELRSGKRSPGMDELIDLFTRGLTLLPDYIPPNGQIPTRMMEPYDDIDTHYTVGNVLVMADVGSVGKVKPPTASQYYKRRYRLEFQGGLKDISNINPAQQEVLYAPGSHFRVDAIRDGKVKDKKGVAGSPQAHRHITLRYLPSGSDELRRTDADSVIDLRRVLA